MISKQTYSQSAVWLPDTEGNTSKKLAGSCEVSVLKLIASASAAHVKFYDSASSADNIPNNLKWVLDASTTDVDYQVFVNPLVFKKGVYAVLEQGSGFSPMICISTVQP
jgi:hypothetical protein